MSKIGFIGLGHMGLPMAINLVKAGHTVTGYDINPSSYQLFHEQGGIAAKTILDTVRDQEILITMVQSGGQVIDICCDQALYQTAPPGLLHIDCSTIDVATSQLLNNTAESYQHSYIDAPVSGGVKGATAGTLTFMVGGTQADFLKAHPFLQQMGKKIFYTGLNGSGQAAKICNNMILGISMIAVSEAFALAEALGLDAEKLFEVVTNSSGQCWSISHYVPVPDILPDVPANHDYKPGFSVAMMVKDLLLSQDAAQIAGVQTILGQEACALYQEFNAEGCGNMDFSAIIKKIKLQRQP